MPRDTEKHRRVHLFSSGRLKELHDRYLDQLPAIAALLAAEQEDPDDFEAAALRALDLVECCMHALEEEDEENE